MNAPGKAETMIMSRKILIAAAAAAAFVAPAVASAQSTSTINLNAQVDQQCMLGAPASTALDLGVLTGADGRLDASKTSAAVLVETEVDTAWCNTPSILKMEAQPLTTVISAYSAPNGFSRQLTYDAVLTGWPTSATVRPLGAGGEAEAPAGVPHAETLVLQISRLNTLNAGGVAETTGLYVEAGDYSGQVILTLTIAP